ncbi:hypothetical protein BJX68DRAFT_125801 [Aspergillus pseudodeflectus]|uniref:Uncharacterized protein n=1 Tax=Aspergillus pseudodeflectus TaxID=176178 RepID=A0ABR4K4R2_9EURO
MAHAPAVRRCGRVVGGLAGCFRGRTLELNRRGLDFIRLVAFPTHSGLPVFSWIALSCWLPLAAWLPGFCSPRTHPTRPDSRHSETSALLELRDDDRQTWLLLEFVQTSDSSAWLDCFRF